MKHIEPVSLTKRYINGLFVNWIVSCGALALPILLSPFLSKQWLPMVVLGELLFLISFMRANRMRNPPTCMRVVYMTSSVLIFSSILMIAFSLIHVKWLFGDMLEEFGMEAHRHLPYLTVLIICPILALSALWGVIAGGRSSFCLEMRSQYKFACDEGFVGQLLRGETIYQIRTLLYIGAFLSLVDWLYYYMAFINVNINTPDMLMFMIMPVAIFVLSVVYMAIRYYNIWGQYAAISPDFGKMQSTELRFLVIAEGMMLLNDDMESLSSGKPIDTPTVISLSNTNYIGDTEARRRFEAMSGIKDFRLRYLYVSTSVAGASKVVHYAVFVDTIKAVEESKLKGKWYNALHISRMEKEGIVSPALGAVFRRIYTVTMAWKTYDYNGKRLYPIKNYKPTFRLKDFGEWNVDYDDPNWLNIAYNNEDRFMFRLRGLWRKYVRSIGC